MSGIDIGARTAPEVALSIMAALVRSIRLEGLGSPTTDGQANPGPSHSPRLRSTPSAG